MVDLSQRTEGNAPAESETTSPKSGSYRPVHGPRPAWPRPGDIKAAIQDQDAGGDPAPADELAQEDIPDQHDADDDAATEVEHASDASEFESTEVPIQGAEDAAPEVLAEDVVTEYRSYETDSESENLGTPQSGSAWAAASAALPEQGYRSCHTPAAERLQRLGSVDMVDDLVAAEETGHSGMSPAAPIKPGLDLDNEAMTDSDIESEAAEMPKRTVVFEDESVASHDESIADRLVPTSTVAAALARQAAQTQSDESDGPTHQFVDRSYAAHERDPSRAPRMPATPKWSESARQHMSNLLAASAENNSAAAMAARIDTSADRYRRSSAMLLLGLPALLLLGFGGAYLYHADSASKGRSIVAGLQSAVSATAIGVATETKLSPTGKITESIIEKQEAERAANIARPEPNLPPPIAPDLAESKTPDPAPPVKVVEAQPVPAAEPAAQPQAAQPSDSRSGIVLEWPAKKPVATAEPQQPAITSEPRSTAAAPKITITAPTTAAKIVPPEEGSEPTITPTAADPLQPGVIATDPFEAEASAPETTASQQVAALSVPKAATPDSGTAATPAAVPTEPAAGLNAAPAQDDESAKLVARGNEHLEIGDIVAARLLFELAVSNGSAQAATAMGRSYDPTYFETMGVRGVRPDAAKAAEWYEKAIAAGDTSAKTDLQKLSAWLNQ